MPIYFHNVALVTTAVCTEHFNTTVGQSNGKEKMQIIEEEEKKKKKKKERKKKERGFMKGQPCCSKVFNNANYAWHKI